MSDENNKIVYTALSRMTADRDVIKQAYQSWQSTFAGQPLDIFAVVDHIESFLGLETGEKKVLMMSMHSYAGAGGANLKEVPGFITGGSTASASDSVEAAPVSVKEPVIALAQVYFNEMTNGVARRGAKYKAELLEIIEEEGLPGIDGALKDALNSLDDGQINMPSGVSEDDCKTICHEIYTLACEVVGPQDADDLSYKAVNAMMQENEASRYDPKNLI